MNLHVRELGVRSNPSVLFLHGFLGSGEDWAPVAEQLSSRCHTVLVDLPGHGRSGAGAVGHRYDVNSTAAAVADLLQGLRKPVLVGYSLGGRIALATAIAMQDRLAGLVLESANPGIEDYQERRRRAELDDRRAQRLITEGTRSFVEQWYRNGLFASLQSRPEALEALITRRAAGRAEELAAALRNLSVGRQQPLWDKLDSFGLPTLFVAGDLDLKYAAIGRRVAAAAKNARLAIIADAGHNTHYERPQRFARRVLGFLEQLGR
jgi:2-succinyl-6-hydroxy-2,4-cyclohexadiene-1-carboxylate synthase